jgi:hypothetical protein
MALTTFLAGVLVTLVFFVMFMPSKTVNAPQNATICPTLPSIPSQICVCPAPPICPPEKVCPELTCPEKACPVTVCPNLTCPTIIIPDDVKDKALNLKPNTEAPAMQDGFFKCKAQMLDIFHIKPLSQFWEGNPRMNYAEFARNIKEVAAEVNGSYCFNIQTGSNYGVNGLLHGKGFFLNNSIWWWNYTNISVEHSNLTEWKDADNLTWLRNETWLEWNLSGDLWVERR